MNSEFKSTTNDRTQLADGKMRKGEKQECIISVFIRFYHLYTAHG